VPAADLDRLRSSRDAAAASVEAATVAVAMARKAATDADVRAPFAGLVTARLKGEGEWISTMPPAPLIMLAEVDPLDLKVDVPASLLPRVKVGDALTVRLPAVDREITTRITRVVPQVMAQTRAFSVYAELPNEDGSLAPGLFAEVRLAGSAPRAAAEPPRDADPRPQGSAAQ
jgi:RND family efflux transporter MFP subunit